MPSFPAPTLPDSPVPPPPSDLPVLIVGAGPVGLTLAVALTRLGVAARVIDRADATKQQPRAAMVWQRALELLAPLGVAPRLAEAALPLEAVELHAGGRRMGELPLGQIDGPYPHPLVVEQHVTERLLAERLAELGGKIEWGTEATGLEQDEREVCVTVRRADADAGAGASAGMIRASWVVGCDGSGSVVRQAARIAYEGGPRANLQIVQIDARARWRWPRVPGRALYFLEPDVALGCFPLPGDQEAWRFFAYLPDPEPRRADPPTLDEMRALIGRVAHAPELALTLTEPRWLGRARFQDRVAATLVAGRCLVAGDAAHGWTPLGGHGMNIGLRGACNLAWKLAAVQQGQARDVLLRTYSDEMREVVRAYLELTKLDFVENLHSRAGLRLLETVAPAALRLAPLRRWIDLTLSDTRSGHRGGPLAWSVRDAPVAGLHAGDRVADGWLEDAATGEPLRLTRPDAYGRWLLAWVTPAGSTASEAAAALAALSAVAGEYQIAVDSRACRVRSRGAAGHRGSEVASGLLLIRPDGYVGVASPAAAAAAQLRGYCESFFHRRADGEI